MGAKTNYAENKYIDTFIRGQSKPGISTWYVALATSSLGKHAVSLTIALNDTLFIQDDDSKWRLYKCTTAGTTNASKPSYPGAKNEAVTDGSAVLTEQNSALEDASGIVEPAGGAYARVGVAASFSEWAGTQAVGSATISSGTGATTSNNSAVAFADPTADWGWCGLFVLFDALTGGNAWIVDSLDNPVNISNGMINVEFAPGALQYTEDD